MIDAAFLPFALAFFLGIIVKAVDWLDDTKKSKNPLKYLFAIIYGLGIGYLISTASFSMLFLAAVVAQVFAKKIDTAAHRLGVLATALGILSFGFPPFDPAVFVYFLVFAFLDEADYIGKLRPLTEYRPFLKVAAFAFILLGRWDYFAGIIAFDVGYELFRLLQTNKKRR